LLPQKTSLSMAGGEQFNYDYTTDQNVGLEVGKVYRLKVSGTPLRSDLSVYPTIEVINRLYPPEGLAQKFPLLVQITQEDIEQAHSGKLVTKVIYLENPETAIATKNLKGTIMEHEVSAQQDPLHFADNYGRAMAILRIGSRIPEQHGPSYTFLFGAPHFETYGEQQTTPLSHSPKKITGASQRTLTLPNTQIVDPSVLPVSGNKKGKATIPVISLPPSPKTEGLPGKRRTSQRVQLRTSDLQGSISAGIWR
ncbi:MAG: hypothetical protein MPJ24_10530, partial [Pirellulaceae bacterium]|nr:hypothetical protein [Pirellulaceae bacterium]